MLDFKMKDGDLAINDNADIEVTESVCQAVRIRLLWFLDEWRLSEGMGMDYFGVLLIKDPVESQIEAEIIETILEVDEVTGVDDIEISIDNESRTAKIVVTFSTDEDTYREEVEIG